jgi:hypothetical protein
LHNTQQDAVIKKIIRWITSLHEKSTFTLRYKGVSRNQYAQAYIETTFITTAS